MTRRWWVLGLVSCVSVSALLAAPGVVTTKDGRTLQGDVTEKDDNVVIKIRGIDTIVPRDNIEKINYVADVKKQFEERMAALNEKDVAGRIELARWVFDQGDYVLTQQALESALAIDPNNKEASELLETTRSQMRLRDGGRPRPPVGNTGNNNNQGNTPVAAPERRLLTADDINVIRQKETRFSDRGVRVRFENDVRNKYLAKTGEDKTVFYKLTDVEQAEKIMQPGNEALWADVKIATDPQSISEYKRIVQPMVLANCATAGCHSGQTSSSLVLFTPADTDAVSYTNFYILQNHVKQSAEAKGGGVFAATGARRMIDRSQPQQSLLLNYMLPPDQTEIDHPTVVGFRPTSPTRDHARYRQIEDWMSKTLLPVQPDYGIKYQVPGPAATQPTTTPAQ